MPGIRPDARRVSKARLLSQDLQNADLAKSPPQHPNAGLLVPMQDCIVLHTWLVSDRPPSKNSRRQRSHPRLSIEKIISNAHIFHLSETLPPLSPEHFKTLFQIQNQHSLPIVLHL